MIGHDPHSLKAAELGITRTHAKTLHYYNAYGMTRPLFKSNLAAFNLRRCHWIADNFMKLQGPENKAKWAEYTDDQSVRLSVAFNTLIKFLPKEADFDPQHPILKVITVGEDLKLAYRLALTSYSEAALPTIAALLHTILVSMSPSEGVIQHDKI
jgi:hypothetical protein